MNASGNLSCLLTPPLYAVRVPRKSIELISEGDADRYRKFIYLNKRFYNIFPIIAALTPKYFIIYYYSLFKNFK